MHFFFLFLAQTLCHFMNRLHSHNVNTFIVVFFSCFIESKEEALFFFFMLLLDQLCLAFLLCYSEQFKHGNSTVILRCSCTPPVTLDEFFFLSVYFHALVKKSYASISTLVNVRHPSLLSLLCICLSFFSTIVFFFDWRYELIFLLLLFGTICFVIFK